MFIFVLYHPINFHVKTKYGHNEQCQNLNCSTEKFRTENKANMDLYKTTKKDVSTGAREKAFSADRSYMSCAFAVSAKAQYSVNNSVCSSGLTIS